MRIPKIIHYCWFGGAEFSQLIKDCMESWKKLCPDYLIIKWDESNFDVNSVPYVREAYENKKWAFVSDYVRFWAIYEYGGIYLDVDVEIIKPIDVFLQSPFFAFETLESVNPGLIMASYKKDPFIKKMLQIYEKETFVKNGKISLETICERTTEELLSQGLKLDGSMQVIKEYTIYPTDYFSPKDMNTGKINITQNTHSIHHFAGSWLDEEIIFYKNKKAWFVKRFGVRIGTFLCKAYMIICHPKRSLKLKKKEK